MEKATNFSRNLAAAKSSDTSQQAPKTDEMKETAPLFAVPPAPLTNQLPLAPSTVATTTAQIESTTGCNHTSTSGAMLILGSGYNAKHEQGLASTLVGKWDIFSIDIINMPNESAAEVKLTNDITVYRIHSNGDIASIMEILQDKNYASYRIIDSIHFAGSKEAATLRTLLTAKSTDVTVTSFVSPLGASSLLAIGTQVRIPATKVVEEKIQALGFDAKRTKQLTIFIGTRLNALSKNLTANNTIGNFYEDLRDLLAFPNYNASDKQSIFNMLTQLFNDHVDYAAVMHGTSKLDSI
jgi:hypothetical protein